MPEITYFDARGRAEPVRLCYALRGVKWTEKRPDRHVMHTDKETYPYGQVPRLVDDEIAVLQSLAILRHVGRKLDLYGKSDAEAARIDSLLDGLEDMRNKTRALVYGAKLSDEGFRHYVKTVLGPPPLPQASTGGSVMAIFEKFASELNGSYYCNSGISIADIALFNMVDCHLPLFPLHMNAFPALLAHHKKIQAEKGISEYLQSDKRPSNFWGSDWLKQRDGKGWGELHRDALSAVNIPALLAILTVGVALATKP